MKCSQPLAETHPELTVFDSPGYREYRIHNWRLARDGSGRIVTGYHTLSWKDVVISLVLSMLWLKLKFSFYGRVCLVVIALGHLYMKCTQVLSESVIVLSPHGIQLETRRGFSTVTCFTSRRFIPLVALKDCLINEGLMGWNVRYYLALIRNDETGKLSVEVAFEHILPHFPVLLQVYRGVHDILYTKHSHS